MASLTLLPAEFLNHITSYLMSPSLQGFEDDGICNLRLTCRALCLKTQCSFAKAAFCILRLDLQPKTLHRWSEVCRVPAFAGVVKMIVFAHWLDEFIKFPDVEEEVQAEGRGDEKENRLERHVRYVLSAVFNEAFAGLKSLGGVAMVLPFAVPFRRFDSSLKREDLLFGRAKVQSVTLNYTDDLSIYT
jgi:hypothetical protein